MNCDTNKDGKCDLNCDTNGDGKCDENCDTDGDGKCDDKCTSIDIDDKEEYILTFTDSATFNRKNILPGWTGTKTFKIKNNTSTKQTISMQWINVTNTFTSVNNLYYNVKRGSTIILKTTRAPYKDTVISSSISIPANTTYTFTFNFEFRNTSVNQDIDKGKTFDGKIKVTIK